MDEIAPENGKETFRSGVSADKLDIETKNLVDLMALPLAIPEYQRAYCWEDKEISRFWDKLIESSSDKCDLHLGSIILQRVDTRKSKETSAETSDADANASTCTTQYEIVDGQQRLITLALFMKQLGAEEATLPILKIKVKDRVSIEHIKNAKAVIANLVRGHRTDERLVYLREHLIFTLISVPADKPDLAFIFFSNQNSNGVALNDYDLLKAHHLRFISEEKTAKAAAAKWDKLSREKESTLDDRENGTQKLQIFLGGHIYSLRKLLHKELEIPRGNYVRDEFQAARAISTMQPSICNLHYNETASKEDRCYVFRYYESLEGGESFFSFTESFNNKYQGFISTSAVKKLRKSFRWEQRYYASIIESLLFAYYLKFGDRYLFEALFCICAAFGEHRYSNRSARRSSILEWANNGNLLHILEKAPAPTFFIAAASAAFPRGISDFDRDDRDKPIDLEPIQKRFYNTLCGLFDNISDFEDETIRQKVADEYGKRALR